MAQVVASSWITDSCAVVRIMLWCEMTKEYLKMADVFGCPVEPGRFNYAMNNPKATYAAHAINSHEELVAEVERLREMVCRIGMYLEMSGEYPENESDNPISQWLYDSIQYMASTVDD